MEEKSDFKKRMEALIKSENNKILELLHESEQQLQQTQVSHKIPKSKIPTPFFKSYNNKKNRLTWKRE